MITEVKVPNNYTPFKQLDICSNQLINVKVPIAIGHHIPFLVGKGAHPIVWLNLLPDRADQESIEVVRENQSTMKEVIVKTNTSKTIISAENIVLMDVSVIENDYAKVNSIDLRPMGLKIFGDEKGLYVVNQIIRENSFKNVDAMIRVSLK